MALQRQPMSARACHFRLETGDCCVVTSLPLQWWRLVRAAITSNVASSSRRVTCADVLSYGAVIGL